MQGSRIPCTLSAAPATPPLPPSLLVWRGTTWALSLYWSCSFLCVGGGGVFFSHPFVFLPWLSKARNTNLQYLITFYLSRLTLIWFFRLKIPYTYHFFVSQVIFFVWLKNKISPTWASYWYLKHVMCLPLHRAPQTKDGGNEHDARDSEATRSVSCDIIFMRVGVIYFRCMQQLLVVPLSILYHLHLVHYTRQVPPESSSLDEVLNKYCNNQGGECILTRLVNHSPAYIISLFGR